MGMHFINGSIMEVKMKELSIKDQKSLTGGWWNMGMGPIVMGPGITIRDLIRAFGLKNLLGLVPTN